METIQYRVEVYVSVERGYARNGYPVGRSFGINIWQSTWAITLGYCRPGLLNRSILGLIPSPSQNV